MLRFSIVPLLVALVLVSACVGSQGTAATVGPHLVRVGSFDSPVHVTAPPHDTHRVFVVEPAGRIRVLKDGTTLAQPFFDIRSRVVSGGE